MEENEEDSQEIYQETNAEEKLCREAKQKYLTEEILEKNYDPRLFTYHCELTKEANLDI